MMEQTLHLPLAVLRASRALAARDVRAAPPAAR